MGSQHRISANRAGGRLSGHLRLRIEPRARVVETLFAPTELSSVWVATAPISPGVMFAVIVFSRCWFIVFLFQSTYVCGGIISAAATSNNTSN